jgi:Leucine-rich repeat (LRR) protein
MGRSKKSSHIGKSAICADACDCVICQQIKTRDAIVAGYVRHEKRAIDMSKYAGLTMIFLNMNEINSIDGITLPNNVETFDVSGNPLCIVKNVNFANAKYITMANCGIVAMKGLTFRGCVELYDIGHNKIDAFYNAEYPSECRNLILRHNRIIAIKEFPNIKRLRMIDLEHNGIYDIQHHYGPFGDELEELRLNNNKIICVCNLNLNPGAIKRLHLANNCIKCINGLTNVETAEFIDLSDNMIEEFTIQCPIKRVNLDGNRAINLQKCKFLLGAMNVSLRRCGLKTFENSVEFLMSISGLINLEENFELQKIGKEKIRNYIGDFAP